jgi:hypothetical protein
MQWGIDGLMIWMELHYVADSQLHSEVTPGVQGDW